MTTAIRRVQLGFRCEIWLEDMDSGVIWMIAESTDLKVTQRKLRLRRRDQKWKTNTEREKSPQRKQEKQVM